ncbi:MAG: T9SS type A sorting domain-containing protein, partial [Microscillaceae bacterium]|nr:T9SS type A sorting domain-containing protein [Microscillaceae bacterium]MDW8461240.1 T9SS type A sorting domain-containing protein [Cytophagales bacterium]
TNTIGQTGSNTKTLSVASGATFQTNRSLNDVVDTGVTKSYSTGAHFVFSRNTAGSISTGTDLPATVASITINHTGTTPTIDLSANLSTGSMTLTNGVFNISGRSVTLTGATPISRTNGTLTTNNTTDLTFNASSNFTIPNGTFTNNPTILRNLTVNVGSPNLLSLGDQDINIENGGTITMTSGDLNIKGRVIKLCNTCSISEDITNSHIIRDATATTDTGTQGGYIETTRTVTTSSSGMAGLGVFLRRSSGSDYTVTIRRYHYTAGNGQGIRLVYKMSGSISGTNTNIGLRRPTSEENPNNYTTAQLVQIYRWSSGSWSDISSTDTGCFGGDVCTSSGQNSFSDWSLGSSQHPLPITLLRFQGKALNSRQAQLTWQTAFEKDNQGFEIEKSLDGANFTNIAFVQGVGNSNRLRNYQYLDNEFNQSAYYRLKQIDRDGIHYSYSETMFIRHQAEIGKAQIYPNPVANELKIFGLDQEKATNFTLFNAQGQMLCQVNDTPQEATKVLNTQLEKLPQGIYFLQIWQNGNLQTEKLIKY